MRQHKYIVFLRGLPSQLSPDDIGRLTTAPCSDVSNDDHFGVIKAKLGKLGYVCGDFLQFSYAGGELIGPDNNKAWQPNPYTCSDSAQRHVTSVARLADMLERFQQAHTNAQFVIIGHSQGGLIAFKLLEELYAGKLSSVPVATVATLDSPLEGVRLTADLRIIRFTGSCRFDQLIDSDARTDLLIRYESRRYALENLRTVDWAIHRGIAVLTLGNWDDCIYSLQHCRSREPIHIEGRIPRPVVREGFPSSALTQVVKNAGMRGLEDAAGYRLYDFCASLFPISCAPGHSTIKTDEQATNDLRDVIGAQFR